MNKNDLIKKNSPSYLDLRLKKVLKATEEKQEKEKKLLESIASSLGPEAKAKLQAIEEEQQNKLKEKEEKKERERKLLESLNVYLSSLIIDNPDKVEIIEQEIIEAVAEIPVEIITEELPLVAQTPSIAVAANPVIIPPTPEAIPVGFRKELDIVKKTIQDLHKLIARQSSLLAGASHGGGEVNLRYLDDIDRSTIVQGHFLTYDNSSKKFIFSQIAEGNVDLSHIGQDLTPGANGAHNIGSTTDYWANLYIDNINVVGGINANGSVGTNGQVLTSNGSVVYWNDPAVIPDLLHITSNIIPNTDNSYSLGNTSNRWSSIHVGPGTVFIQDQSNSSLNAALTVNNGILQINGANQLQVGQLKFVNNTIESANGNVDIQIGLTSSSANLVFNRNTVLASGKTLTFGDNTTQNTAYLPNIRTPRIISGTPNTVTIDFSTDTTIHFHTNAGTVTANLINFTAGKQVDVIIYNNIGGTQQYNHGLSTSNRAVGGSSFFLCSHPTMWVTYICEDNTETNCFVKASV